MLGENGKLKGDLTLLNWGDGTYWIMGSYYLRQWHMRWFETHASPGATVRDIAAAFGVADSTVRRIIKRQVWKDVA